ncbi:hypothetical protein QNO07_17165 [Streptomyces sp. 549]|uniref:hypothetical protein n=1 Tax=Streptomyces sp. 549 TaxID=3049076 RepID=UPI0024C3A444|nr:hypothetical protein [Streptomyces sp. 549]MDK1475123.1 hypothetical protein [Streptomyces sp. 549]
MLALRLIRGAQRTALLQRLAVAAVAGVTGFLLLCALGFALSHPGEPGAAATRLLWCLLPLAATTQLAVAVARAVPGGDSRSGLDAVGLGPAGLPVLAAISTAVSCLLGSALALLVFLHLRGDVTGLPFDGQAADLVAADRPLPVPAALTLLLVLPAVAATASALALRRRARTAAPGADGTTPGPAPAPAPAELPWGAALVALGLALEAYTGHRGADQLPPPGGGAPAPGVVAGWLLVAAGLVLAGPGLVHLTGRLLAAGRPGAARLLAGRGLQEEARTVGRPVGVLAAVACGAIAVVTLHGAVRPFGVLTVLGASVVLACAIGTALHAAAEARSGRAPAHAVLDRLGAPRAARHGVRWWRAGALVTVLAPLTWVVARLIALPLSV